MLIIFETVREFFQNFFEKKLRIPRFTASSVFFFKTSLTSLVSDLAIHSFAFSSDIPASLHASITPSAETTSNPRTRYSNQNVENVEIPRCQYLCHKVLESRSILSG